MKPAREHVRRAEFAAVDLRAGLRLVQATSRVTTSEIPGLRSIATNAAPSGP